MAIQQQSSVGVGFPVPVTANLRGIEYSLVSTSAQRHGTLFRIKAVRIFAPIGISRRNLSVMGNWYFQIVFISLPLSKRFFPHFFTHFLKCFIEGHRFITLAVIVKDVGSGGWGPGNKAHSVHPKKTNHEKKYENNKNPVYVVHLIPT